MILTIDLEYKVATPRRRSYVEGDRIDYVELDVQTNFRKVAEGQVQFGFRQKWRRQKTGKCPILGTSLQGDFHCFRGPIRTHKLV